MSGRGFGRCACALGVLLAATAGLPLRWQGPVALATGPVAGQERTRVDVEAGASREVLSDGHEPWEEYWVRATVRPASSTFVYGGIRRTRRFGEDDRQWEAGAGWPAAERWNLRLDGTWSGTHRAVPRWSAEGSAAYRFAPGWTGSAGGGRQVWERATVDHQWAGLERRFARISIGYRLGFQQIDTGGRGIRHGLTGTGVYDDRGSSLTLGLGIGRTATIVGPGELRATTERSARISGTHWLDDRTGLSYTFGVHRHGPYFTRSSSSIGVRRRL